MGFWRTRYTVVAIMFVAFVLSYVDRMVMSVSIPYIAKDFNLSPVTMGVVMSAFFFGYALMQLPAGMLADKFGARKIITLGLIWWSIFTAATAWVGSYVSMLVVRALFGIGEAALPPSFFKSVSIWTPLRERGTANSIVSSSNSLGPALAPLFAVAVIASFGWRSVFSFLFIPGLIMAAIVWFFFADTPEKSRFVSPREMEEITGSRTAPVKAPKPNYAEAFKNPIIWKMLITVFFAAITGWGFMTWLPTYLVKARGLSLANMGLAASYPFFAGVVGAVLAGIISDKYFARKRNILFLILVLITTVFLYLMFEVRDLSMAIVYNTLAGFFLFGANAAIWTIPVTVLPKETMGASSGIINMGNQIAGFLAPIVIGFLVQLSGGGFTTTFYFLIAACLISALASLTLKDSSNPQNDPGIEA